MKHLYIPANEVKPGDTLPSVSRQRVTNVTVFPNESVRITFGHGEFIRHTPYGGPDFGWECFHVTRESK